MGKFKEYFKIYESEDTKAVFEENDYAANRLSFYVILTCAVILIVSWVLNMAGIFTVAKSRMNILTIAGLVEFAVPIVLYLKFKGKRRWLKYVMVIVLLFVCTQLFSILNHNVILIMILPVLLSSRYFSKGFTVMISILTVLCAAAGSVLSVLYGIIDLNFYPSPASGTVMMIEKKLRDAVMALGIDPSKAVVSMMVNGFLPRLLVFAVIGFIAVFIAKNGHDMVLRQDKIARMSANVKAELNTATQIQNGMVPNIFPAFPEQKQFDVYAGMYTAKEVGGDFYDFFLIDDDHIALVMADVSGKGVPAALFMVIAKTLIKNHAQLGEYSPAKVLSCANEQLCEGNEAELFVTVWLAILQISTGKGLAANAGHEHPVLRHADGKFEFVKYRHSPAVATMEGMRFREHEFQLLPGDSLFVYTDGVPEATNAEDELFGEERLLKALNSQPEVLPKGMLKNVKDAVDMFVGEAPQFDDLTMLGFTYYGTEGMQDV